MGIMDTLFGGGTELAVSLAQATVVSGGVVAGKVTVRGGRRPRTITSVVVEVRAVAVTNGDGPLPGIELETLCATTCAVNVALPAGKPITFAFQVALPGGLDPGGHYQLAVRADIPGVRDPSAACDLTVIAPGRRGAASGDTEQDLLSRYPGLLDDEHEQFTALCQLCADAYGKDAKQLAGLAPWLLALARTGPRDLRDEALATWSAILNNRARPSDIAALEAFAADPDLTHDHRRAVVTAATRFADEGAAPLLARLARDPDPEIREQVARSLHHEADEGLPCRLELVLQLAQDADVTVRRSAVAALGIFHESLPAMQLAVTLASTDRSAEVRAAALEALAYAHFSGQLELVVSTYEACVASPIVEVRIAIASRVSMLPPDPRVTAIVRALLADPSSEVRSKMAWAGVHMTEHPELEPLFRQVAETDAAPEVRAEAVSGMRGFLTPAAAIAYARARFAADGSEPMCWTAIDVARAFDHEQTAAALLEDVTRCNYANAAASARDALREI